MFSASPVCTEIGICQILEEAFEDILIIIHQSTNGSSTLKLAMPLCCLETVLPKTLHHVIKWKNVYPAAKHFLAALLSNDSGCCMYTCMASQQYSH